MVNMLYLLLINIIIIKLYLKYTLQILDATSHILAIIFYYCEIRRNIIEYNLKTVFPNIDKNKMNHIRFKSIKIFFINILIGINQCLFYDSFLNRYYDSNNFIFSKKSTILLYHLGIFNDFVSFYKQNKQSFYAIYKGKFTFPFKSYPIKLVKNNKIKYNDMIKYNIIATSIDQKSKGGEVYFLNSKVSFHDSLIKYSIIDKRTIFLYCVLYNDKIFKLTPKIIKINITNKKIDEVVQEIANIISKIIKKYPEQYLWAHNRFNISCVK